MREASSLAGTQFETRLLDHFTRLEGVSEHQGG